MISFRMGLRGADVCILGIWSVLFSGVGKIGVLLRRRSVLPLHTPPLYEEVCLETGSAPLFYVG